MKTNELQAKQQTELHSQLWKIANDLRGSMNADEFKNYILSLIFYRYLSENLLTFINQELADDNISYKDAWKKSNFKNELINILTGEMGIGYIIEPQFLWDEMISEINKGEKGKFDIEMLQKAINQVNESTIGKVSQEDFEHLFDDMDLSSSKLGRGEKERSALISKIMIKINDIDFHFQDTQIDILGDAYEYLIGQFATSAGKKAGEYYTPQQVSKLLAKLVTVGKKRLKNVYDPTCGSGSLLLRVSREIEVGSFYGQEKAATTYNLARMNMLLHKIPFTKFNIWNADTLENPYQKHLNMKFDAIVANPPYSAQWSATEKFNDDERFSAYGKLAPKSKADYAFVQHMIYLLDDAGTMAVVLPHGVLFRGASEGIIRKYLIEQKNYLDAVIGLPTNLFFGTSIPTCILVFKKHKTTNDVLFIDASKEYESGKNQNRLTDKNLEKILQTYVARKFVDKYAAIINIKSTNPEENTIEKNDYNLNIPRYVDTFEAEQEIDIKAVLKNIRNLKIEAAKLDEEIEGYLKELGISLND